MSTRRGPLPVSLGYPFWLRPQALVSVLTSNLWLYWWLDRRLLSQDPWDLHAKSPSHELRNFFVVVRVKADPNALKTVVMFFQKQCPNVSHLRISINDVFIQLSMKPSLGFTLNSQHKWSSNVNAKAVAAKKDFFGVWSCLRASWGLDRKRIQFIHLTVIEPILLYGFSLFSSQRQGLRNPDPFKASFSQSQ